ncbi:hypothetical protein HAX54_011412 [Datura stramonium]|uniref:Uncharacterized protein n=1 Tax=Datura stramonium TaxID=4076 RepID=A0ABS8TJQ4_DATST|nr:hypothetical protein [Datura stramonium]
MGKLEYHKGDRSNPGIWSYEGVAEHILCFLKLCFFAPISGIGRNNLSSYCKREHGVQGHSVLASIRHNIYTKDCKIKVYRKPGLKFPKIAFYDYIGNNSKKAKDYSERCSMDNLDGIALDDDDGIVRADGPFRRRNQVVLNK